MKPSQAGPQCRDYDLLCRFSRTFLSQGYTSVTYKSGGNERDSLLSLMSNRSFRGFDGRISECRVGFIKRRTHVLATFGKFNPVCGARLEAPMDEVPA